MDLKKFLDTPESRIIDNYSSINELPNEIWLVARSPSAVAQLIKESKGRKIIRVSDKDVPEINGVKTIHGAGGTIKFIGEEDPNFDISYYDMSTEEFMKDIKK